MFHLTGEQLNIVMMMIICVVIFIVISNVSSYYQAFLSRFSNYRVAADPCADYLSNPMFDRCALFVQVVNFVTKDHFITFWHPQASQQRALLARTGEMLMTTKTILLMMTNTVMLMMTTMMKMNLKR